MKRVVITGMGIISSLGNNKEEVNTSLLHSTSGIALCEEYRDMGFRSHLAGGLKIDPKEHIDRKTYRFMGDAAAYCYLAMKEAIEDAGLSHEQVSNERTGLIVGSGGASNANVVESADLMRQSGVKKVGPYRVTRAMGSTTSACLATPFEIKGRSFSISSACSTSAHCIGTALEQIQMGAQDVMFAGGGEELHWSMSVLFDAMGALSTKNNDNPTVASRAFDEDRDGFVISGGGGMLVLESLEHAEARGAKIYAEIVGYGANSDGFNMVRPSGEGAVRCMKAALANVDGPIDYLNTHGTSTGEGDAREIAAINAVREQHEINNVTSTKSLSGHSLGAAGVHEAIYALLMMEHGFIPPSANIDNLMPEAGDCPIVQEFKEIPVKRAMSNSFGFGGVNVSLVFQKMD